MELLYEVLAFLVLYYCIWQVFQYVMDNTTLFEWRLLEEKWELETQLRWYNEHIRALENLREEINNQLIQKEQEG